MSEEILIILLVAAVGCFAFVLPVGLFIWMLVLSKRLNKLTREIASLQKYALGQADLKQAAGQTAVLPAAVKAEQPFKTVPGAVPAAAVSAAVPAAAAAAAAAVPPAAGELNAASIFGIEEPSAVQTQAADAPDAAAETGPARQTAAAAAEVQQEYNRPLQGRPAAAGSVKRTKSSYSKSTAPAAPAASKPAQPAESGGDVAGFMLGNLFNKLGALVVIIAAGIFVKLIAPYVFFNPWVKLIAGYLAGSAVLGTGLFLHGRGKYLSYAEVLIGLGLAVDFVMTYASCTVLEVLSVQAALVIACLLLVLVYGLAAYMKRPSMLVLGLIAGYANLCFYGSMSVGSSVGPTFVSVYLLLLNIMTLTAIYRARMWLLVGNANLMASLCVLLVYLESGHNGSSEQLVTFTCLSFWTLYVVFDILRYRRGICARFADVSSYLNFFCLSLFTGLVMFMWEHSAFQIGLAMLAVSAAYALLSFYYKFIDEKIGHAHLNMCLLALLIGIDAMDQGLISVILQTGIALGLTCWACVNKRKALLNWVLVYLTAALWPLLFGPGGKALLDLREAENFMEAVRDFGHLYLFEIGIPAAGFMLASFLLKVRGKDEGLASYCLTFKLLGWTLLYILLSTEIAPLFGNAVGGWFRRLINQGSTYCILAFVYCLQWYNIGKFQNKQWLRGLSYFVYAWTVCVLGVLLLMCVVDDGKTNFIPFFCMRFCAVIAGLVTTFILYRGTRFRLFAYIALALGFGGMHVEAVGLAELSVSYVVTACWLAYAATTVFVGLYKPNNDCTYAGILLVLLTVGRLFMVDTSDLDEIYKLMLFIAVGGALLALSFLYTKWYRTEKQNIALSLSAAGSASLQPADVNDPLQSEFGNVPPQPSVGNAPFKTESDPAPFKSQTDNAPPE